MPRGSSPKPAPSRHGPWAKSGDPEGMDSGVPENAAQLMSAVWIVPVTIGLSVVIIVITLCVCGQDRRGDLLEALRILLRHRPTGAVGRTHVSQAAGNERDQRANRQMIPNQSRSD